jgi:hypothetical protein
VIKLIDTSTATNFERVDPEFEVKVYPNPTKSSVKLLINTNEFKNIRYTLLDMDGKLLESKIVDKKETMINTAPFETGAYKVLIMNNKDILYSTTILKVE